MRWPWSRRETRSTPLRLEELLFPDDPSYAGASRFTTTEAALRLSAVWACVRLLADTVSTFAGRRVPAGFAGPAATHDWLYQTMVSLLLRGNAYGLITARVGAAMRPAQVELVHPDLVAVTVAPDGRVEYRYRGTVVDGDGL